MATDPQPPPRTVIIKDQPIQLCQLLKLAHLVDSGGAAALEVAEGRVWVNGQVETRKRRKLRTGDVVSYGDQRLLIQDC